MWPRAPFAAASPRCQRGSRLSLASAGWLWPSSGCRHGLGHAAIAGSCLPGSSHRGILWQPHFPRALQLFSRRGECRCSPLPPVVPANQFPAKSSDQMPEDGSSKPGTAGGAREGCNTLSILPSAEYCLGKTMSLFFKCNLREILAFPTRRLPRRARLPQPAVPCRSRQQRQRRPRCFCPRLILNLRPKKADPVLSAVYEAAAEGWDGRAGHGQDEACCTRDAVGRGPGGQCSRCATLHRVTLNLAGASRNPSAALLQRAEETANNSPCQAALPLPALPSVPGQGVKPPPTQRQSARAPSRLTDKAHGPARCSAVSKRARSSSLQRSFVLPSLGGLGGILGACFDPAVFPLVQHGGCGRGSAGVARLGGQRSGQSAGEVQHRA